MTFQSSRDLPSASRPLALSPGRGRIASVAFAVAAVTLGAPVSAAARPDALALAPAPAPSATASWELLEDLRILTNEDPAEYAPRLEALLAAFREVPPKDSLERARAEENLTKLRRARLTLARAHLANGDEEAALRTLDAIRRESVGVDVDFGAMGPSLADLAKTLDPPRGAPPTITCGSACVVVLEGRIVALDTRGQPQSLRVPYGTYELIIAPAGGLSPTPTGSSSPDEVERTFVTIRQNESTPASLRWPSAAYDEAPASAPPPSPQTDSSTLRAGFPDARSRRTAALALGITGGALAVLGAVLVGLRPGCSTAPCATSPAVLTGVAALGAGIPLTAGALGIGLTRDPSPSPAQASGYRLVVHGRF